MTGRGRYGIRFRVLALWLVAVSPLFALALINAREERQLLVRDALSDVQLLTQITAEQHRGLVRESQQLLATLSQTDAVGRCNAADCERIFRKILETDRRFANLGAIRPDGEIFASGVPMTEPATAADREFYVRALETGRFTVGEYHIGELSHRPVVVFALPVTRVDGVLNCILFATLDLEVLGSQTLPPGLPKGSSVTILDASGTVLLRQPDAEAWIGREIADHPFYATARGAAEAGIAEEKGLDGVQRLYSFSTLLGVSDGERVILAVGVPVDAVTSEASRLEARNLLILLLLTLFGGTASWFAGDRMIVRLFGRVYDRSIHDPLTRTYNRDFLLYHGPSECALAVSGGEPLSVVLMDIDHFKKVNDTHGHLVGDEVLREVAHRMQTVLRHGDTLTRYGGEEFCAVLPGTEITDAREIAERLRAALSADPVPTGAGPVSITISAGVATLETGHADFGALLKEADAQLYRSKTDGRNRVSSRKHVVK